MISLLQIGFDFYSFGIDCTELIKVIAEIWEHWSVMTMKNGEETRAQRPT